MGVSEFLKKHELKLVIFFLIIAGILIWKYYELPGITPDWVACADYIKEGILYQDQPKCYHGPVNFFIIYFLREFFSQNFINIYKIIVLISTALLYFLLYKIIKKINLKPHFILLTILFFTLIYVTTLLNDSGDSLYSALITLLGFYILYFFKNEYYKYLFSSFFFAIAVFTKVNSLIPIGLILIYHFKDFFIKNKKIHIDHAKLIKALILMFIPPFIIIIILIKLFPKIITYSILTQVIVEPFFLLIKLKEFFNGTEAPLLPQLIFLILFSLISIYVFIKNKDLFSFVSLFGFILITYGMLRGHYGYLHRYYIPIFLFFIIGIIHTLNNIKINYKKMLFILLILIFSLSSLKISDPYFSSLEYRELKNIINKGFKFIPEQKGRILSDTDYFIKYTENIDPKKVDILIDRYNVDATGFQRFKTLGIVDQNLTTSQNLKIITVRQYNEILDLAKKINDGYYSMIVIGQLFQGSAVIKLLGIPLLDYEDTSLGFNEDRPAIPYKVSNLTFCSRDFPILKRLCPNCRTADKLFFLDITKEECMNLSTKLIQYYYDNFDEVCNLDNEMANTLKEHIPAINKECKSKKYILEKLYEGKIATFKEALLILFFILSVIFYYSLQIKRNN